MRYAVNAYDWMQFFLAPFSPECLLLGPLLTQESVQCVKNRPDEDAILVKEDITPERWDAVVILLRRKHHRNKHRLYQSKTGRGGWERV